MRVGALASVTDGAGRGRIHAARRDAKRRDGSVRFTGDTRHVSHGSRAPSTFGASTPTCTGLSRVRTERVAIYALEAERETVG